MTSRGHALDDATQLIWQAHASPFGLLIQTSNFQTMQQRLYKARARLADPSLNDLQFRPSPFPDGNLIITRVRAEHGLGAPSIQHLTPALIEGL